MRAEAAEGAAMSSTGYARGLLCECGARRSDNSRRLCAQRRYLKAPWEINSVEAATSPWWKEPDGVLARVRGDLVGEARRIIRDGLPGCAGCADPSTTRRPWSRQEM